MLAEKRVWVVIPAFQEEERVMATLLGVPEWVDGVVVVDDGSTDGTARCVLGFTSPRVHLETHSKNLGVGRAIATGYRKALNLGADAIAVMAGDNQMDPSDLVSILNPVVSGEADYVKGNRLLHRERDSMPRLRRLGTRVLGAITSWLCGLEFSDSQCGYTAISRRAAPFVVTSEIWNRYGYPNDLLMKLAFLHFRITEVAVRPVYQGEKSGLRAYHVLLILFVMMRRLWLHRTEARQAQGSPT